MYAAPLYHSRKGYFKRYFLKMSKQKNFVRYTEIPASSELPMNSASTNVSLANIAPLQHVKC